METPIKMDDLGVPLFLETPIYTLRIQKCPKKEISLAILFCGGDFSTTNPPIGDREGSGFLGIQYAEHHYTSFLFVW